MTWEQLVELGLELPDVAVDSWYRTPALKVRGKGFVRLKEDARSVVILVETLEEKEMLLASNPELYFTEDHYNGDAMVLAHLSKLRVAEAKKRLLQAWRTKAPPALKKAAANREA